jgi:DNA-binding IclR family transcriptional regulator
MAPPRDLVGTSVVILNKIDPPNRITMFSRVGIAVPAHCTGQGKTLLAFSPRERVEEVINANGLKRYTANTITTADGLFEELRRIRERGYTIDDSEHEQHIRCVGVPILGKQDEAEAALSITGLAMDFESHERIESTAQMLREAAQHIRKDLGFC